MAEANSWAAFGGDARANLLGGPVSWVAAAALAVVALSKRRAWILLLLVGMLAGTTGGGLFWQRWRADHAELTTGGSRQWVAEAINDPRVNEFGSRSEVLARAGARTYRLTCNWPADGRVPEPGEICEFTGATRAPSSSESARRAHQSGVVGTLKPRGLQVTGTARTLRGAITGFRQASAFRIESVEGAGGDLLLGVLLGDRRRLTGTEADVSFRTTGLSHLVAVSGGHLVVVAALVTWMLRQLRVRRLAVAVAVTTSIGIYVVLSGVQASAVRAWLMSAVLSGVGLTGRRGDGLGALCTAMVVALAAYPPTAFDLGFQLSVLSVAGLLLYARLGEAWAVMAVGPRLRKLGGPIALTLVAQAATLPLTVATFASVSLVSPIANLAVSPLVSLLLVVGLAGILVAPVWSAAGHFLLMLAGTAGSMATALAGWLASLPYAAIPLGWSALPAGCAFTLAGAAVWIAWPQPSRRVAKRVAAVAMCGLIVIASGGFRLQSGDPRITVLDVGQGDAVLVSADGRTALVDAGPSTSGMRAAAARHGLRRVDVFVGTHLHADHVDGIEGLEGVVSVETAIVSAGAADDDADALEVLERMGAQIREVTAGTRFKVGGFEFTVVWPREPIEDGSENESSVVMLATCGEFSALLTGDAETLVLDEVVRSGLVGDIDVLKVGHHGSAKAVSPELLAVLKPELALISCGTGNRYGHPTPEALQRLEAVGTRVLRTDLSGDLIVEVGDGSYVVKTQKRGSADDRYATLMRLPTDGVEGTDEQYRQSCPARACLSDRERAEAPCGPGPRAASEALRRDGRHRYRHADLLGRERGSRRHPDRLQHAAVRLRAPPRDRS